MWEKAKKGGLLESIEIGDNTGYITHLQFANNTLLFTTYNIEKHTNLWILLHLLEAVTGLIVSWDTCELIGIQFYEFDRE